MHSVLYLHPSLVHSEEGTFVPLPQISVSLLTSLICLVFAQCAASLPRPAELSIHQTCREWITFPDPAVFLETEQLCIYKILPSL